MYPQAPSGVSVDDNMSIVKKRFGRLVGPSDYLWFYKQVRNTGSWDFKQKGPHENFGNFHYGAVGYAGGILANVLLRAAGCAQMRAGTSLDEFGNCLSSPPLW